ncbi:hypothetical protein [Candidatus Pelagibacter sp.]|uniref:hypothetical protein n=1 Tax=Candidatus Pelagibacter sp. TaxID=2024849 RepID=UPI003F854900
MINLFYRFLNKNIYRFDYMNFLSKLAKGEYSLPMTFWVYGTLYQIIIGAIMIATIYFGVASVDTSGIDYSQEKSVVIEQVFSSMGLGYLIAILLEILILLIYTIIVTIGLWRSASNRDGWFWSGLVKIMIVGSLLYYLYGVLVSYNII